MTLLWQLLVNGIVVGAVYGLFALAFGTTYFVAKVFHVALAAVFAVAAFSYYSLAADGWPAVAALPVCIAAAVLTGVACELLVYRPLRRRGADDMLLLVGSLAALTLVTSTVAIVWGHIPLPVPDLGGGQVFALGGVTLTSRQLIIVGVGVAVAAAVTAFMALSTEGRKMRAVSDNPVLAGAMGISVPRSYLWAFVVGSVVAAVAAVLYASGRTITPLIGLNPTLVGAVAVIFGGTGRPVPNFLTGIVLGVIESLALWRLSSEWGTSVLFGLLFLVLLLRPHGLFGSSRTALQH